MDYSMLIDFTYLIFLQDDMQIKFIQLIRNNSGLLDFCQSLLSIEEATEEVAPAAALETVLLATFTIFDTAPFPP
jgi:hypothetical protein